MITILVIASYLDIAYFTAIQKPKAGGTAIFVADRLKCFQITNIKLKSNSCEDVWVEIGVDKTNLLLLGVFTETHHMTLNVLKNPT